MAIKLEVCSVIVPLEKIREKLGDHVYEDQYSMITDVSWHDEYLYRAGCMNDYDLSDLLDEWEEKDFELLTIIDGEKHWKDVCVVNSGHGPSYPCEWIEYDAEKNIVWLKGQEPGDAIGPEGRNVFGEDTE
jgi:hypothetical protein